MNAPAPIKRHPNASFVLGTTPLTGLVAWAALRLGLVLPQWVAAAGATLLSSGLLVFRAAIARAASTVWQIGVVGIARRIWKGQGQGGRGRRN